MRSQPKDWARWQGPNDSVEVVRFYLHVSVLAKKHTVVMSPRNKQSDLGYLYYTAIQTYCIETSNPGNALTVSISNGGSTASFMLGKESAKGDEGY